MQGGERKKILLIRLSSIGDILLTSPVIRLLRKKFPDAQIDFLTKARFADLLRYNPQLSNLLQFPEAGDTAALISTWREIHGQNYHAIIDLHKNVRSLIFSVCQRNEIMSRFRKQGWRRALLVKFGLDVNPENRSVIQRYIDTAFSLGITDDGEGTELFLPGGIETEIEVKTGYSFPANENRIAMAPGAAHFTKRWPIENFKSVAVALIHQGRKCCILGGPGDQVLGRDLAAVSPEIVDLTGKLTLLESAAVLRQCDRLITNDTGLMHMAEAVKTPVTAIFGSTVRQLGFFPFLERSHVVENLTVSCRPCSHVGRKNCPKGHFQCMNSIHPEMVLDKVLK